MPPILNRANRVLGTASVCAALIAALAAAPASFAASIRLDQTLALGTARALDPIETGARPLARQTAPRAIPFYETHLLPRMSKQLSRLAPINPGPVPGLPFEDDIRMGELTRQVSRRMESAAGRALQDFLMDTTALGRVAEIEKSHRSKNGRSRSRSIIFGVSHGLPEVELKYKRARGTMRLGLAANGNLGLELSGGRHGRHRAFAAYDMKDERLTFLFRIGM